MASASSTDSPASDDQSLGARASSLALQLVPVLGGTAGFVAFVAIIGGAIEWVRFDAAGLPATQAVYATPEGELVVAGAWDLAVFVLLGLLAVLVVFVWRRSDVGHISWCIVLLAGTESAVVAYMVGRGGALAELVVGVAALLGATWLAASFDGGDALPQIRLTMDRRALRSARKRWNTCNAQTEWATEWLTRVKKAEAPNAVVTDAELKIASAIRSQGRAEDQLRELLDSFKARYASDFSLLPGEEHS
jgi:hypothetical protein